MKVKCCNAVMVPGWNLLLANCFSLGSFEIQIVKTEQQIRAEQVPAAAEAGGLKFISKLWNPFMQKTYVRYILSTSRSRPCRRACRPCSSSC